MKELNTGLVIFRMLGLPLISVTDSGKRYAKLGRRNEDKRRTHRLSYIS